MCVLINALLTVERENSARRHDVWIEHSEVHMKDGGHYFSYKPANKVHCIYITL